MKKGKLATLSDAVIIVLFIATVTAGILSRSDYVYALGIVALLVAVFRYWLYSEHERKRLAGQ